MLLIYSQAERSAPLRPSQMRTPHTRCQPGDPWAPMPAGTLLRVPPLPPGHSMGSVPGVWGRGPCCSTPGARRLGRPSRVRFSDPEGTVLFEHPVQKSAAPEDGMVRGAGRAGWEA